MQGNADAASLRTSYQGMLFGADHHFSENTRLGLAVGLGNSRFNARGRSAHGKIDNYTLSVFGSTRWQATQWRYGATQGWHSVNSQRHVTLPTPAASKPATTPGPRNCLPSSAYPINGAR
jgi:outer membrane autotransporter protein